MTSRSRAAGDTAVHHPPEVATASAKRHSYPISCVRCDTAYAVTAYRPSIASTSAEMANAPNIEPKMRSGQRSLASASSSRAIWKMGRSSSIRAGRGARCRRPLTRRASIARRSSHWGAGRGVRQVGDGSNAASSSSFWRTLGTMPMIVSQPVAPMSGPSGPISMRSPRRCDLKSAAGREPLVHDHDRPPFVERLERAAESRRNPQRLEVALSRRDCRHARKPAIAGHWAPFDRDRALGAAHARRRRRDGGQHVRHRRELIVELTVERASPIKRLIPLRGSSTRIVTNPSVLMPASRQTCATTLRSIRPPPVSRTMASETCTTTSAPVHRCERRLPAMARPVSFRPTRLAREA